MVDKGNTYGERVSRLVGWGHWFAFFNIISAMLIGTRYIAQSPWPETLLGQFYLAVSWVGHFGFLVFAIYLLILFPLTFLIPSRKLFRLVAVCFATVGLTVLLVDTQAYQSINLHLNPVVWEVLFSDDSESAVTADLQHLFVVLPLIFLIELALSEWVWHKQRRLSHKRVGRPIAAFFFVSFIASHLTYVWADAYFYSPITSQRANFPLSYPMTAKSFMQKHGLLDRDEYLKRQAESENADIVNYPLEPIEFNRRPNDLNILVVSVNNLRSDALNEQEMPNTYAFAQQSLNFTNHYSSSNDMFGVFGLFYGLPSSYETSIRSQATKPVVIKALENQDYQFGLFSGGNFDDNLYAETMFIDKSLTELPKDGNGPNDNQAINAWSQWVTQQPNGKPWFSFIELTTLEDFQMQGNGKGSATEKLRSGYQQSVQHADEELAKLFEEIQTLQLQDNTMVVITSNHGIEFNETKTNSWGANSNYSQYQLQVPMVIYWPGKVPGVYSHRTSHLDFSVTLMQDLLGVSSKPSDFSSGRNMFDESKRRWIIAGDSRELALITDSSTTVIDKFGNFKLYDQDYHRLQDENPTLPVLMQGLTELQRFYTKSN
ncbi:DUF3413 domain-containing protein [Vibrio sp. AK197]|uniref:DUF3413 domain-containing protein n=1 Tax=Vibrio olivae TaxID=1243002 RepID=A0ABV5HHI5_9VIBR